MLLALIACRPELAGPPVDPVDPDREPLADGPVDGLASAGLGALWSSGGEVWALAPVPAGATADPVGTGEPRIRASADLGDGELLVLGGDGSLLQYDAAGLGPSLLVGVVEGAVDAVQGADRAVWIGSDAGLSRWSAGAIAPYHLDGAPIVGLFAAGCRVAGAPAVWVVDGDGTFAIDPGSGAVVDGLPWAADRLGCDVSGALYAAVRGKLHRVHADHDAVLPVAGTVREVWADPAGVGAWVTTDDAVLHAVDDRLTPVKVDPPSLAAVDELGRLLVGGPDGAERLSVGRPVGVVGLPDVVTASTPFTVVPTASADVPTLTAQVVPCSADGDCSDEAVADVEAAPIPLDPAGAGTLDPLRFPVGPIRLDLAAVYPDGQNSTRTALLRVGTFDVPITWDTAIQPLYAARCGGCHDDPGRTQTRLGTEQDWVDQIDDVVREIEAGAMPLGGPTLTPTEIALVTTWRDAGFP